MKFKALIVDDEYPARQELRHILSEIEEIEVVGEAANGVEAKILVEALDYSVIFLDIQMPGLTGLELGELIQGLEHPPAVIFVTAYDNYAIKAFEVNAIDYLLKPFSEERVQQSVEKIKKYYTGRSKMAVPTSLEQKVKDEIRDGKKGPELDTRERVAASMDVNISLITVEKQGKTLLLDESEIYYIFTEKEYVFIKTKTEKLITKFSLKDLENRLSPNKFFRIHRCYIVNLKKVTEIIPLFNGTCNLVVADAEKSQVPVSRTQTKKLKKILGI